MDKNAPATRNDIEEVLSILKGFMNEVSIKFQAIDKHFDAMDKRFDHIDKRFDRLEAKVDGHGHRITQVETDGTILKKLVSLQ